MNVKIYLSNTWSCSIKSRLGFNILKALENIKQKTDWVRIERKQSPRFVHNKTKTES